MPARGCGGTEPGSKQCGRTLAGGLRLGRRPKTPGKARKSAGEALAKGVPGLEGANARPEALAALLRLARPARGRRQAGQPAVGWRKVASTSADSGRLNR